MFHFCFQGFAGGPGEQRVIDIVQRGRLVADSCDLKTMFPEKVGNYIICVRPPSGPGATAWIPVYIGEAGGVSAGGTLRSRMANYLSNKHRTFGPYKEQSKYAALLELQARGFSIQVRCVTHRAWRSCPVVMLLRSAAGSVCQGCACLYAWHLQLPSQYQCKRGWLVLPLHVARMQVPAEPDGP